MDWGMQSTGARSHTPTPWLEEEGRRQGRHVGWTCSISQGREEILSAGYVTELSEIQEISYINFES